VDILKRYFIEKGLDDSGHGALGIGAFEKHGHETSNYEDIS
jgi:hypothetical protein